MTVNTINLRNMHKLARLAIKAQNCRIVLGNIVFGFDLDLGRSQFQIPGRIENVIDQIYLI